MLHSLRMQSLSFSQSLLSKYQARDNADFRIFQMESYKPNGAYADTMRRWLGTDVASRGGWLWGKNFLQIIGGTVIDSWNAHALPNNEAKTDR